MKDIILEAYVGNFVKNFGFQEMHAKDPNMVFENFANYCLVQKSYPDDFDISDVSVGGAGDSALDGVAILINGRLTISPEAVDHLIKTVKNIDVEFVFIQSKTSDHFSSADIGNFLFGVKDFFNRESTLPINDKIAAMRELRDHIFNNSIHFAANPVCRMFYVTTGVWKAEPAITARVDSDTQDLYDTKLFRHVEFIAVDAEKLKQIYRELVGNTVQEIVFDKHVAIPEIEGVRQSYIGVLSCLEFLKLIVDSEGNLRRSAFYDNVRDFQGDNPVNKEIKTTLLDAQQQPMLPILNNGITIVAKEIKVTGTKFILYNYQIVNGCQTSNIIFNAWQKDNTQIFDKTNLPVRIIETTDSEITNTIIKATNRQTEVKSEAFESLADFHKKLEQFYQSVSHRQGPQLYYERRSKQYEGAEIQRFQVVTVTGQVNAFISVFLDDPHSTHQYYGELLDKYRSRMFQDGHNLYPYYISAAIMFKISEYTHNGFLQHEWVRYKFHLAMLYRQLLIGSSIPPLSNKGKLDSLCEKIHLALADDNKSREILLKAGSIIINARKIAGIQVDGNHAARQKRFTDTVKQLALELRK